MSPKLIHKIPQQKFEIVRDAIAAILKIELDHQVATYPEGVIPEGITYRASMLSVLDKEDLPMVIVSVNNSDFEAKDATSRDATYRYNIDVYVNPEGDESNGVIEKDAIIGAVRYILDHPNYANLGFAPGSISTSRVESFTVMDQRSGADTEMIASGRLDFTVNMVEENVLNEANMLNEALSAVRLSLTDKGYVYEYINKD